MSSKAERAVRVVTHLTKAIVVPDADVREKRRWGLTIDRMMELFVRPAMLEEGRTAFGSAVIQLFDGQPTNVELEAKLVLEKKKGDLTPDIVGKNLVVDLKDVENVSWVEDAVDLNSAKVMIVRFNKDYWVLNFDFRYHQARARAKYDRAVEFLHGVDTAKPYPAIYLLWSAAELTADCYACVQARILDIEKSRSHHARGKLVGQLSGTSQISDGFAKAFKALSNIKNDVRYGHNVAASCREQEKLEEMRADVRSQLEAFKSYMGW